jgi:hypothetical protein
MLMTQKTFKHNNQFLKMAVGKTAPKNTQRTIWIEPVNRTNRFIDTKKIIEIEAKEIIHNYQSFNNNYEPKKFKAAAEKLNLIVKNNTTHDYWRGERFYAKKNIPDGIYELSQNTSITDSLAVAKKFTQKKQKLYDHYDIYSPNTKTVTQPTLESPKKGTLLKVTVPAGVDIIKIPENHEFFLYENEYVIPAGTLVRIETQGTHIHVLSPQEEHNERLKANKI